MSAGLAEVLTVHPELYALLADSAVPNFKVVEAVNDLLGPDFTTTEASVRRARMKLEEQQDGAKNTTRSTFTEKDRQVLHGRLDQLLDRANMNPGEVAGLRVSQWDGMTKDKEDNPVVTTLYGVNLNVRKFDQSQVQRVPSLEELALIRDYTPAGHSIPIRKIDGTLVVALGDLQVGKVNAGTGTAELWDRVRATTAEVVRHLEERATRPQRIVLLHAGDCIEGSTSQGGRLVKKQDLYLTSQVDAYQRMLEFQVVELAPLCNALDVAVVPGNHDETTRQWEVPTEDSWAIFAARNAARFIEAAGTVPNVSWHFPGHDKLAVELDIGSLDGPFYLTMVHGHRIATSANSIMDWWRRAAFGNQPGAKSRILVTGHFHHYRSETAGDGRTWIQVPAMDGGSAWFANKRGDDTPPGMVTFWLDQSKQYPIRNLIVHSEEAVA